MILLRKKTPKQSHKPKGLLMRPSDKTVNELLMKSVKQAVKDCGHENLTYIAEEMINLTSENMSSKEIEKKIHRLITDYATSDEYVN